MLLIAATRVLHFQFIFHSRLTEPFRIPDINDLPESSRSPNEPSTENGPSGHSLPKKRWAYAFLMAGCDPDVRGHVGYLMNILASSHMLRTSGSEADVVVMVRMSTKSKHDALIVEEEEWLRACGVKIKYLPRMNSEEADSFYSAMLDKFQILDLTEYSRVIFLDSDVIPLCNMDYIFELSEGGRVGNGNVTLKENLVVAWKHEPSQGGFFMLRPGIGELAELQEVVRVREEKSRNLTWPPFDEIDGWGHAIEPHDSWIQFNGKRGRKWDFYGAFADQGLLYHWVKYVKKKVSIVIKNRVENWDTNVMGNGEKGSLYMEISKDDVLVEHSCSTKDPFRRGYMLAYPPYRDYHHFTGWGKPWRGNDTEPHKLWFHTLQKVIGKYNLSIDIGDMRIGKPPLGLYPTWHQMRQVREAGDKERNKTTIIMNTTQG